jgi:hypothetical protein
MINWAYVAGFFDGEGNLHMDKHTSTVQLRFDNTCLEAIEKIREYIKCGTISNRGRQKPHHKDRYRLTIANHLDVLHLLERMMPYLIVKKVAAQEMVSYIKGRKWRRQRKSTHSFW